MSLAIYRALTTIGEPGFRVALALRRRSGKEDPARLGERFGRADRPRPPGPLLWLHAVSVGESLSALGLIERLLAERPDLHALATTATVSSARLLERRLPARAFHQYAPVDRAAWVRRFLDHWRPDLALWSESELWPNLLAETQRRGIPTALVNARMSERSYRRWRRFRGLLAPLLGGFELVLAQDSVQASRLEALGARDPRSIGNLKFSTPPLPADEGGLAELRAALGARPAWLAASTHDGEEAIAAAVHARLKPSHRGLLTIVAPRHPPRGAMIARELARSGMALARRSLREPLSPSTDIYLADTLGELGLLYRAAGIVFLGKSLTVRGGHNPIEPAQLGAAVVVGPHRENFGAVFDRLRAAGAILEVADADSLADAVDRLLSDIALRERLGAAARAAVAAEAGALDAVLLALSPLLRELGSPPP